MGVRGKAVWLETWLVVSLLSIASLPAASDFRLLEAAKDGNRAAVQLLLNEHSDVNASQKDGTTALAWATSRGDLELVELLIRAGAGVNAANDYGVTPLSLACANGNASMVEKLLQANANPSAPQITGETPLMTCARTGNAVAVSALLAHGADVNAKEPERGQTALMWAAAEKHPEVVEALVGHGADVHARSRILDLYTPFTPLPLLDMNGATVPTYSEQAYFPRKAGGFTPLMFAAQSGDVDSARILVAAGADVNDSTSEDGTALVVASTQGNEDVALFLLEKGANPKATDGYGLTALHWSLQEAITSLSLRGRSATDAYWRHPNMPRLARALLASGADPNARVDKDFMPYEIRRYARHQGNAIPQIDLAGATPFLLAAALDDVTMMRFLVEGGADPKISTYADITPLMAAAGVGRENMSEEQKQHILEAVKIAVLLGGDVNATNGDGRTALHGAAFLGATDVVQFLAEKGANLEAKDKYGQTAMSIALGDPGGFVYRQLFASDVDRRFRDPKENKKLTELLLKLGVAPYTGPIRDRSAD